MAVFRAASAMTTPIEPGPAMSGKAMGEKDTSALVVACCASSSVARRLFSSIEKPEWATTNPPAIWREGRSKPKKRMMSEPLIAKTAKMANT